MSNVKGCKSKIIFLISFKLFSPKVFTNFIWLEDYLTEQVTITKEEYLPYIIPELR